MDQPPPAQPLPDPPPLLVWGGSDWPAYVEVLYQAFVQDFCSLAGVTFRGHRVTAPRMPEDQGKHASFWHVISEGKVEAERTPDPRRCERVPWIGWLVRRADNDPRLSWWENERRTSGGRETHVVILFERERFVVVLARRHNVREQRSYLVLCTAYLVEYGRRFERMLAERDAWKASHGQP